MVRRKWTENLILTFTVKIWGYLPLTRHPSTPPDLEKKIAEEKKGAKELQTKYDLLEEDFVVQKAQVSPLFWLGYAKNGQVQRYFCFFFFFPQQWALTLFWTDIVTRIVDVAERSPTLFR